MKIKTLAVQCPTCKQEVIMTSENPYRPFCSERCQLLDLGAWAKEEHKIPGEELSSNEDGSDIWSDNTHRDE